MGARLVVLLLLLLLLLKRRHECRLVSRLVLAVCAHGSVVVMRVVVVEDSCHFSASGRGRLYCSRSSKIARLVD